MHFSIVLNSRGRPKSLETFLNSITDTTFDSSNTEVLIGVDDDDTETWDFINSWGGMQFGALSFKHGSNLNQNFFDIYKHCQGKYIWILNDDCVLQQRCWDVFAWYRLETELENHRDGLMYGLTQDNSVDKMGIYSSFPILPSRGIEALGYVMDPKFTSHGADVGVWRVYREIGRVCYLPEVKVDHIGHNTLEKVWNPDATQIEIRKNRNLHEINCFTYDISEDVEKLKRVIENA